MPSEPKLIDRAEQPYVAVRQSVTMQTLAVIADELPGLFAWLAERDIEDAGAPFFKYNAIRMPDLLDVEVGIPVATPVPGDGRVLAGVLPAGRFVSVTHRGHPNGLREATAALLDWGAEQDLRWDMSETEQGQTWGLRLELYKTDPAIQPDLNQWETELVFKLADET